MAPQTEASVQFKDTTANPAPLGLLAFGLTTILLNLHNAGFFPLSTMILAMGIFYGGLAQIIVGIMEWKKGNTFGTTAFLSYGCFWLTLVGLLVMPGINLGAAADSSGLAAYLAIWGVFTIGLFIATLKLNRALQVLFATVVILFFLLAIGNATGSTVVKQIAGYEGIICGLSAIYTGFAQLLNEVYGRTMWPIGPVKK